MEMLAGCINADGRGVIPVTLLGSEGFDVRDIDLSSLELDGVEVAMAGRSGKVQANFADVDNDGIVDLIARFPDEGVYDADDFFVTLTGEIDGTPFEAVAPLCLTSNGD